MQRIQQSINIILNKLRVVKTIADCQKCGYEKDSNYGNEKCPRCGAFIYLKPIWINGDYFL